MARLLRRTWCRWWQPVSERHCEAGQVSRRSFTADWSLIETLQANRLFDRAKANEIAAIVGTPMLWQPRPDNIPKWPFDDLDGPDALAWHLNQVAFLVRQDQNEQSRPDRAQVSARVEKARKACAVLAAAFTDADKAPARELREVDLSIAKVRQLVLLAEEIERDLTKAAGQLEAQRGRRKGAPSRGAPRDDAWHLMVARLAATYRQLWIAEPGFSRGSAPKPTGPFLRLVKAVAISLGVLENRTDEAIAQSIKLNA